MMFVLHHLNDMLELLMEPGTGAADGTFFRIHCEFFLFIIFIFFYEFLFIVQFLSQWVHSTGLHGT